MTTDPGNGQVLVDLALFARRRRAWRLHLAVLDRLLEEPRLRIEGISGTSAGAMNAAVLVDGYAEGGATGARARLERFWESVSVLSAGTLDSFPHNGAVVTLLSVCGVSHREGYFDLFMVAIVGALIALAAVILLGSAFGSF